MEREEAKSPKTNETEAVAKAALERALKLGADECAAEVSADRGFSVTYRMGEVEALEYTSEKVLSIAVWKGKRRGSATTSDFSERSVERAVRAAVAIASVAEEDEATGLPDERDLQTVFRDLSLSRPYEGTPEDAIAYLAKAEEAALKADPAVENTDGAVFTTSSGRFTLVNSLGFSAGYDYSRHDVDCVAVAAKGDDFEQDAWWGQGRSALELPDPETLGRRAAERAAAKLGRKAIPGGSVRVLFAPYVATEFLDMLEDLLSGRALYRKTSCLLGREGTSIFPAHVSVLEDPYIPGAIGSGVFDDEGCAGQRRAIVEEGVLRGKFLSSYTARKLGCRTTGNAGGAYNLILTSTETTPDMTEKAMLERLGTGLYVTDTIGRGLNPVTGDYSRGVSGFWVERSVIVHPVGGMTLAGNLLDMFQSVEAVGAEVYDNGARRSGSVLLGPVQLSGES